MRLKLARTPVGYRHHANFEFWGAIKVNGLIQCIVVRLFVCAGSDKKTAAFMQRFEGVECLGSGGVEGDGELLSSGSQHADVKTTPWLLKAGLTPDQVGRACLLACCLGVCADEA